MGVQQAGGGDIDYTVQRKIVKGSAITMAAGAGGVMDDHVDVQGYGTIGLQCIGTWTSTTITVEASNDGSEWDTLYKVDGTAYTIDTFAGGYIQVDCTGVAYIRLKSSEDNEDLTVVPVWEV